MANKTDSCMRGLWLENNRLTFENSLLKPKPKPNEVLVKINVAGICSTDLEIVKGYSANFKGVLGHEFVGTVESAPDQAWVGKRVTSTINFGCNVCAECVTFGSEHCPKRVVLGIIDKDGIFADYAALDQRNLVEIPDDLPSEKAVFTEPLAAALRIREQVRIQPTAKVSVIGPGRLGMLVGKVLSLAGTEVVMVGRRESSLALAKAWGLQTALAKDLADNSFDIAVEATGNAAGFEHALRVTKPKGTIILKSTFAGAPNIDLTKLVVAELTVVGSRCGPFEPAIRLLREGVVDPTDLIDGRYSIEDGERAFEYASQGGVRKILLDFER